jgi:hypothetical protein
LFRCKETGLSKFLKEGCGEFLRHENSFQLSFSSFQSLITDNLLETVN